MRITIYIPDAAAPLVRRAARLDDDGDATSPRDWLAELLEPVARQAVAERLAAIEHDRANVTAREAVASLDSAWPSTLPGERPEPSARS